MASSWFLNLAFKFLHHFAWPLVALLYPLCASVKAIETGSYEETKNLISYWILVSLIYLFEYAFMTLLQWFHLWLYVKLTIVVWLIIPDFGRASYVYNNLICSMKPQIVAYNCWWKCYFEKDSNFLMHVESYVKENGTEALEKLIASKNTCRSDAEATNEIVAIDNKEVLEDIPVMPKNEQSQNVLSVTVETKGTSESDRAGEEVPQSSTQKEVQKEWTCALCLVKTTSEKDLNSHLSGRKHRTAIFEALIAKKQPQLQKQKDAEGMNAIIATNNNKEILETNGERLQTEHKDIKDLEANEEKAIPATKQRTYANIVASQNASSAMEETKGIVKSDTACGEVPQSSTQNEVQKERTCALCMVTTLHEKTWNAHLSGKKHRANCEAALEVKKQHALQKDLSEPFRMIKSRLICTVCKVMLPSEEYMASHLIGRKHLSNIQG